MEMYFYGFYQADVLINFFILLRLAEMITRESFVPAKQEPDCTKEESHLVGMKCFTCIYKI